MKIVFLLLSLLLATPLLAHDTWLEPAQGKALGALNLTSGMGFPALDYAIKPERVARAWGQTLQGEITLPPPRRQAHALVFAAPKASGLFAVQLAPKALELSEDKVVEYLDEIHASAALRQAWQQAPAPRHWREQYSKHSKTLSAAGGDAARLYGQVLGLGMEVVLETNPATLAPGAPLHIRLLQQGVAKASLPVALVGEGGAETAVATTDAEGRALLVVPKPGRWLIRATDLRPSQQPGLDWESDFATLTFRVFPH